MRRRGFTLVEVLAATTLTAILVVSGTVWLNGLQRSASAAMTRAEALRAVEAVAWRWRDDLVHATTDRAIGARDPRGGWSMIIAGAAGGARRDVIWRLQDGEVVRISADMDGGNADRFVIASGISALELQTDGKEGPRLHVAAGTLQATLPIVPGRADAP